jgi:hypothetical protein
MTRKCGRRRRELPDDLKERIGYSVHLMITIQKVTSNVQTFPASLQTFTDTRLTLTTPVSPNSNYVIMVSDLNFLKYVFVCFVL